MLKLKRESLEWALKHAMCEGDTDIFPFPFELKAIENDKERILDYIQRQNVLEWNARAPRRCLSPKHRFGFRIATQIDPLDFLVYTALIYEIGKDLELHRVSMDNDCVFSYRFDPDDEGYIFNKEVNHHMFQLTSRQHIDTGKYPYIVTADIADFYPRLYSHRIENALRAATTHNNHCLSLKNLVAQWNEHYSYGIPVGSAPSRLLAEISIDDVDRALLSEGALFVRFNDDYRIFCASLIEAYNRLAFLANTLFENHGLTLQQHKTRILSVETFKRIYYMTDEETEIQSLTSKFYDLVESLDIGDISTSYIDYDDLTPEQQESIDALNLESLFEEQLQREEIDIPLSRFVLRRLAQLGNLSTVEMIFSGMNQLYPIFTDVIQYFSKLRGLSQDQRNEIGLRLLDTLDDSVISHLEFHRMWLLSLFSNSANWNSVDRLIPIYNQLNDDLSRREMIIALGFAEQDHWFRTRKRSISDFSPWLRRAFLYGGSCLPTDERNHWYQSLQSRLDPLESAVVTWAKQHPL